MLFMTMTITVIGGIVYHLLGKGLGYSLMPFEFLNFNELNI